MFKKTQITIALLVILLPLLGAKTILARDAMEDALASSQTEETAPSNTRWSPLDWGAEIYELLHLQAPLACPAAPAGLPDFVEPLGEEFCLFYNSSNSTATQANNGAAHTADYWEAYVDDMGFPAPEYSDVAVKFHVRLLDTSCNGGVSPGTTFLTVNDGCDSPPAIQPQMYQLVFGHEIYHQIQLSDGGNDPASNNFDALWFHEGTARSMEDKVFEIVDHWPNALTAPFSYNKEVNNYLAHPNNDITSDPMRYESALWWTYYSEQCGAETDETRRGVDAFGALWDAALSANNLAALNNALSTLGCPGFDTMFRSFIVANWTKDLSGLPDASYNYDDEDETGNPAPYGPLVPTDGGTINSATSALWTGQVVNKYSARYYSVTPAANDCPVITASFTRTAGSSEFYHVVTQNGTTFQTHVEGNGASWTQSFLNNGITKIVAIIGGQGNSATVDVALSCADPVLEIVLPNALAPAYVGNFGSPDNFIAQVSVTNGSPTGPVVGGLTNADFSVEIGGLPALVLGGGFVQEEYFLLVDTPIQPANGPYDLEIFLEEPGTASVIASDTEADALVYDATNTDLVIITDVSGSMGWDGKMQAAINAANLFIDASNSTDGLGLASYDHDVVDTLALEFGTLPHRTDAHNQVNAYFAGGATSIGDGLDAAVDLLAASVTGNARCQFTLLSDGMENSSLFWTDVMADVLATDCPVMTVAFGQDSNELLMEDIATATGGAAYYNDVYVSATEGGLSDETALDLGSSYLYSLCEAQGCERLLSEKGVVSEVGEVVTHTLSVDTSVDELAVVLDWQPSVQIPLEPQEGLNFFLFLQAPGGTVYDPGQYAFQDGLAGHVGYRIEDPEIGEWKAIILYQNEVSEAYQVIAYGQTELAVNLLLPALPDDTTGDYMPLFAIWLPGGQVSATVLAPDGTTTEVPMVDDGQHMDGAAGDGFFGGLYTLVNQAFESQPVDEDGVPNPPPASDEGAYRVQLTATLGATTRETQGSFAVQEGEDSNADTVPDEFINTHCPGAPNSDQDLDQLSCSDEYFTGTDPNNSDSDGHGESDESEALRHGQNPLGADDDQIEAPDFVQTQAKNGSVLLTYDVKAEYVSMLAYRATSPTGPWTLLTASLPLTGEYSDATVTNDTTYYYCLQAIDGDDHWSAVVCSEAVTPRVDPVHPEAAVLINDGATTTLTPNVVLTFFSKEEGLEAHAGLQGAFEDIVEVMISNDPSFAGATWQPFQQGIAWQLAPGPGLRTIYVRYRDVNGNESIGVETASIQLEGAVIYLPIVVR